MKTGLILFAHGARDPEWARPLRRVQAVLRERLAAATEVELAFLEFMSPTLEASVSVLVEAGCSRLVVLPMFIAQGGHLKRDLPALLESLRSTYPMVEFRLLSAVGEDELVINAMADAAIEGAGL